MIPGIPYRTVYEVYAPGRDPQRFENRDAAREALYDAAQQLVNDGGELDQDGDFSGRLSWETVQVPDGVVATLVDEYAFETHPMHSAESAVDDWFPNGLPTDGVILVEENGGYWLSAHPDVAAALHYQDNQEHAEDFTIERIVDVATGADLKWRDEHLRLEAIRSLCALRSRLTRVGEDVHAGNVERLARGVTDGTLTTADAAGLLRTMPCPQSIQTYLRLTALHLETLTTAGGTR